MRFRVGIVCVFSAIDSSLCVSSLVSFLPHWGYNTKPNRQDAVFGPLLIASTLVNLVIGIVFIVSDFVVTVFPKVTVWLRTGPPSPQLSTTRELERGIAPKFLLRKTSVSPAGDTGNMSPEISENTPTPLPLTRVVRMESSTVKPQVDAGCMDHNHDIVDQDFVRGPRLRGTTDQGKGTQWNGNVTQNLGRSAVALPVKETIPVKRISKARKVPLVYSSHRRSARETDDYLL